MVFSITLFQHTAREQVLLLSNEEVTLTLYAYGLVCQVVFCSCNHCKPDALWHAHRYLRLAVVPDNTPLPMTMLSKLWQLTAMCQKLHAKLEAVCWAKTYSSLCPPVFWPISKVQMLDVAIVGAGPAGLSAAAALLQCRSKPLRVEVSIARDSGKMLTLHKPLRKTLQ